MNSALEQCPNSVLSQNWVGCTVRTPRTQVKRTLRAQCPCRGHCCAHNKLVAHIARPASTGRTHAGRALVTTRPGSLPPGRDLTSMSRHQGNQNHVATSNRCRDTTQNAPGRDLKTGSRHQTSCRQSTQVATSIFCRDLTLTRPGRDLKSCRDLKLFSPGHNMNFMSRPRTLQS